MSSTAETVLSVRGLRTRLGNTTVLDGIDLQVHRGEVVAILGGSGSGKSTLLRGLNYLTPFTAGDVEIAGHHLRPGMDERTDAEALRAVRTKVGMVFQSFNLFPHLSVIDNVTEAPCQVLGLAPDAARTRGAALLDRVGLGAFLTAFPHTLSGGQQQRVAIARALAMEPTVLLLDEPTSALDPQLVGEVLEVVTDLASRGQTMMIVTHEMSFARRVAHRIVVLAGGKIADSGRPDEVLDHPRTAATRSLLGIE